LSRPSHTVENYLKCIFSLGQGKDERIPTNAIAEKLGTTAASVTDMIKKLSANGYVHYERYHGVTLTRTGRQIAVALIRRHRLWETFLVDKLGFQWDEVHDLAEELEHINNDLLSERLDAFLGNPTVDPHGDPIPDKDGNIQYHEDVSLDQLEAGQQGIIVGVTDHSTDFLQYLEKNGLVIRAVVKVMQVEAYDQSKRLELDKGKQLNVSHKVAANLLVRKMR